MSLSFDTRRRNILDALIAEAPFSGFNQRALDHAARIAIGDAAAAAHAFPNGIREAVDFYLAETDRRMEEALAAKELPNRRIRDRITLAVRTRLELVEAEKEAVRRANAFLLMPQHLGLLTETGWRTVDAMWRAAGDVSTDSNFYTKRLTLAKVYGATFLYWLNDESADHKDTWAFLDRRIDAVMQFGKFKHDLTQKLKGWTGGGRFNPKKRRARY